MSVAQTPKPVELGRPLGPASLGGSTSPTPDGTARPQNRAAVLQNMLPARGQKLRRMRGERRVGGWGEGELDASRTLGPGSRDAPRLQRSIPPIFNTVYAAYLKAACHPPMCATSTGDQVRAQRRALQRAHAGDVTTGAHATFVEM